MADLVIYGSKMSPFVRKVEAVLHEKQLDYDFEEVSIASLPDWYKEISPLHRIPTLRDRSVGKEGVAGTIPDSSAICGYLERKHPTPSVYPEDPFAYGRALWVEEYVDTNLAATGGFGIFRAIMFPSFAGESPDLETARKTWNEKLPRYFDYLELILDDNVYFVGEQFSIADIAVGAQMMQCLLVAGPFDTERWPSLAAHVEMIEARASFRANLETCRAAIARVLPARIDLS